MSWYQVTRTERCYADLMSPAKINMPTPDCSEIWNFLIGFQRSLQKLRFTAMCTVKDVHTDGRTNNQISFQPKISLLWRYMGAGDKQTYSVFSRKVPDIFARFWPNLDFVFITTNQWTIMYHNSISLFNIHCYMFRHFYVKIRKFYICALLSYIYVYNLAQHKRKTPWW